MAIKTTTWALDTCDCVIEYQWDDSLPPDQITTTPSNVVKKCTFHSSLSNNTTFFNTLLEENPRKNIAYQHILDNGPTTLYDIVNGNRQIKPGVSINFTWSGTAPNRVLTLTLVGATLTTAQKNTVQTALNNKFGIGKITLINN